MGGFLSEWLESKRGRRPATYQGYVHALRPVIQRYGHLQLQAFDGPHLETLKKGMLSGELRRRLVAVNVGECVERVECDPDADPERVGWQAEQVRAFLAHMRGHGLYAAFLLSCCGLRRGGCSGCGCRRWCSPAGAHADGAVEPGAGRQRDTRARPEVTGLPA